MSTMIAVIVVWGFAMLGVWAMVAVNFGEDSVVEPLDETDEVV